MTGAEAHRLLDGLKAGVHVPLALINEALMQTGDLDCHVTTQYLTAAGYRPPELFSSRPVDNPLYLRRDSRIDADTTDWLIPTATPTGTPRLALNSTGEPPLSNESGAERFSRRVAA